MVRTAAGLQKYHATRDVDHGIKKFTVIVICVDGKIGSVVFHIFSWKYNVFIILIKRNSKQKISKDSKKSNSKTDWTFFAMIKLTY